MYKGRNCIQKLVNGFKNMSHKLRQNKSKKKSVSETKTDIIESA